MNPRNSSPWAAAATTLLVCAMAGTLLAQEARKQAADAGRSDPDRPRPAATGDSAGKASDAPTFADLRNSLGDLEQRESKEDKDRREAIVQKNADETLKIYEDALGKRNGELHNVSRRLDVNQGLEGKYDKLLKATRIKLATTRSQFINRTVGLKKSLDDGKISKDAYDKLLEEDTKRFRNREKELLDDINFYGEEEQTASRSIKDLATKKELMSFDPFSGTDPVVEAERAPKVGIAQKIQTTLGEVSGYRSRSVVDALR